MTHSLLHSYPILAKKADKKSILRFYKDNHYSARFIGCDNCYLIKEDDNIIASLIISQASMSPQQNVCADDISSDVYQNLLQDNLHANLQINNTSQYLLHALLIAPIYRKLGYAEHLLEYAITQHQPLVSFARASLSRLYLKNGFTLIADDLLSKRLTPALFNRFQQYSKNKSELKAFIHL